MYNKKNCISIHSYTKKINQNEALLSHLSCSINWYKISKSSRINIISKRVEILMKKSKGEWLPAEERFYENRMVKDIVMQQEYIY